MGDEPKRFTEGQIKKGGVNAKPTSPKPDVKPVAQKPGTTPPAKEIKKAQ